MIEVITPPTVSTPKVKGVTSINKMSWSEEPDKAAAYTAAPAPTASSGWIDLLGVLPPK